MGVDEQPNYSTRPVVVAPAPVGNKPAVLAPGTPLGGRYRIEKELGGGAVGVVYLAHDQKLHDRKVVIKLLRERWDDSGQKEYFEKKFNEEIAALSRIEHPGVVGALDVGELDDGRSYLVMQYVHGKTLRTQIGPHGMELSRVANLFRQIGQALTAAHKRGVLHRDLKPENIMLQMSDDDDDEYSKLIDFGIATVIDELTPAGIKTTTVAGTALYMAPEQLEGKPEAASDIYALGVVAYELVTGQLPFNPDSPYQLLEMQRAGVRVKPRELRPSLPESAQEAILKALSFAPQDRYGSAKEFTNALVSALTENAGRAIPEGRQLAQVLFTDLVGYSKLSIEEQARWLKELRKAVRGTNEYQRAQLNNQLFSLPTGDGVALVFFGGDPVAAVKCAVEIARALKSRPEIKLRMGVHIGLVQVITDINDKPNVSGGGINIAQRVMAFGGAGHILLSRTVADDLSQLDEWASHLRDCGERVVKHGRRVHIFNLYTGEVGNPRCPRATRVPWLLIAVLLAVAAALGMTAWLSAASRRKNEPAVVDTPGPAVERRNEPEPVPVRQLSYSLTLLKDPRRYRGSKPSQMSGETAVEAGDQVRLNVSSPQAGYLYAVNEGPEQTTDGMPDFIILFPSTNANGGSAEVKPNRPIQIPQPSRQPDRDWLVFDNDKGTEKIWLVWSETTVPELEAVKGRANPKDRGVIKDPGQVRAVAQYLRAHPANQTEIGKDEASKQTTLKSKDEPLVGLMKLEHH
jgi:serine/threonine-protein kinase